MFMHFNFRRSACAIVLSLFSVAALAADAELAAPTGDVILSIKGVETTNAGAAAQFDIDMLQDLPSTEFTTTTIWTEGPQTFRGVLLGDLMEAVGYEGDMISAQAINDYAVEIPMTDAVEGGPIVAYQQNGKEMTIRDKGPLWVIYPYDSSEDYQSEVIYSRSIWQLDRITAK